MNIKNKDLSKNKTKLKATHDRSVMAAIIMGSFVKYSVIDPFENIERVVELTDKLIEELNKIENQ